MGKSVILISDDQFLANHIIYFFKYAIQNQFDNEIISMSKSDFKRNQNNYKNYIVFERKTIIQDNDKLVDSKKLTIEKSIAKK